MTRRYVERTLMLESTYHAPGGTVTVTDALAVGAGERGHELGAGAPGALLRQVTCTEGVVEVDVDYAPWPEYGLVAPLLHGVEGGLLARGGADVLTLSSPMPFDAETDTATETDGPTARRPDGPTARLRLSLSAGDTVGFASQHCSSWQDPPPLWSHAGRVGGARRPLGRCLPGPPPPAAGSCSDALPPAV